MNADRIAGATPGNVNYVILFQGRAGSSYLRDVLRRHPDIVARGEMLESLRDNSAEELQQGGLKRRYAVLARLSKGTAQQRQQKAIELLYNPGDRPKPVIGFKTKVYDIENLEGVKEILEANGVRAIVLNRKNLVKQAVSHILSGRLHERTAQKYGKRAWNLFDEADRLAPQHIEYEELEHQLRHVAFHDTMLQAYADYLDMPKLFLEYSDMLRDRQKWLGSVFEFLGVQPVFAESAVLKNTPDALQDALVNFADLRRKYVGTRFEWMFDEVQSVVATPQVGAVAIE